MTIPVIGGKYTGPVLDRPALRQLPAGWQLTLEDDSSPTTFELALYAIAALLGSWMACCVLFNLW